MVKGRSTFKVLIDKHTGRRPLERPRLKLEDNCIMFLTEIHFNVKAGLIRLRLEIIGKPC